MPAIFLFGEDFPIIPVLPVILAFPILRDIPVPVLPRFSVNKSLG